jgi:hypothetical protein
MPRAADTGNAGHAPEPEEASHVGNGVWVKRWSTGTTDPGPLTVVPPEEDPELDAGAPDPLDHTPLRPDPLDPAATGTTLPAGIERELRAVHGAIADLRRELRELRTGREERG